MESLSARVERLRPVVCGLGYGCPIHRRISLINAEGS